MNERILELADEDRIKFSSHWAHEGVDTAVIIRRDLKEFAELIVRECGVVINSENYREHSKGWNDAIVWADGMIKEHFGVRE